MKKRFISCMTIALVSGCISYTAVGPGTLEYGELRVPTSKAWNLAPKEATPVVRSDSKVLTQDGVLLDRIVIIPGVPDGEPLFRTTKNQVFPAFRADMLPNEIEEMTESSLAKLLGEGQAAVETANLRPHRYGGNNGFLFDVSIAVSDGPGYDGAVGAFVVEEKLYLIVYLGALPYYYEKHLDEALAIIKGARLSI